MDEHPAPPDEPVCDCYIPLDLEPIDDLELGIFRLLRLDRG